VRLGQLQARPELIAAVVQYEHRRRDAVEQCKAVVQFVNGTRLHSSEVWLDGALCKYAYYQVTPDGEVVRGWDNAPHHPDVRTSPHHLHDAGETCPSSVRTLSDVRDLLAEALLNHQGHTPATDVQTFRPHVQ